MAAPLSPCRAVSQARISPENMTATEPVPVPSTREFTLLGLSYGLYALGLLLLWPAFIGLAIAYAKRADAAGSFMGAHYRWLINTFWGWVLGFVAAIGILAAMALPAAIELGRTVQSTGEVRIPWTLMSSAVVGGLLVTAVWCWVIYRLIRGALRLADAQPVP
jgi:uncharacterized membrane protein